MPLDVKGIDHVQIAVPRALEAACLAFYRGVFAFPELPKPDELRARGGAWFQVGALQMHIGVDEDASASAVVSKFAISPISASFANFETKTTLASIVWLVSPRLRNSNEADIRYSEFRNRDTSSKRHICFLVGDLAAAKAEIVSRGIMIEDEGRAEGLVRFFIRDPAGNRIEIGQRYIAATVKGEPGKSSA